MYYIQENKISLTHWIIRIQESLYLIKEEVKDNWYRNQSKNQKYYKITILLFSCNTFKKNICF